MIAMVFDNIARLSDLVRGDGNLGTDEGLETAVLISLFTNRRALPDDVLPEPLGSREGFWADKFPDVEGDLIGSRLWLLHRSKTTESNLNKGRVYAEEALAWLVEDGVASEVNVTTSRYSMSVMLIAVEIVKPDDVASRWTSTWQYHLDRL